MKQDKGTKLNKAQKESIEYTDGPLLIVAGAGTGKTTVITQKIAHLISSGVAQPEEILALTFTDKAAGEMVERVDQLLDIGYTDLQISTFHAFCQRILEHHGLDIGIPNQFTLLTGTDAWLLVREHFNRFDLDYYRPLGNPNKHIHELISHFQKCKDELISPAEYLAYAESTALQKDTVQTDEKSRLTELANAYHTYNQILLDNTALDFADLIFYTHKLFSERPNILEALQKRFRYILVDEFQDVNAAQYELVRLLSGGKENQLTVVGDDDQSIYAFRGASVSNILKFKDDFSKAKEIVLNENYRSGQEILDIAYKSIQHNNPDRLEVKLKIDKQLKAKNEKQKACVEHVHLASIEDEVGFLINKIKNLKSESEDSTWDDFAVLVRANNHADPFIQALEAEGLPYEFLASSGLYRQPIVLDAINFFKLLDNYHESAAIYRLLRLPFFAFAENDMQKLTGMAKRKSISYYEALKSAPLFGLSESGVAICDKLVRLIHNGMKQARFDKPTKVLLSFFQDSGYFSYLTKEEEKGSRAVMRSLQHMKQFFEYIESYQRAVPEATVSGFVEHYHHIRQSGDDGALYQPTDTPDSINIMTVHASKGLEFKYVFIANLVEDRFPSRSRKEPIEIPEALIKEQLPEGNSHEQEERRLFYVAMTRAKEQLYLLSADMYGGVRKKKISRFLAELNYEQPSTKVVDQDTIIFQENATTTKEEIHHDEYLYDLPKAYSVSQLKQYQSCPYQYKLAHILKIPAKGSASFSFGSSIHNTLQAFYEQVKTQNSASQGSLFAAPEPVQKNGEIAVPTIDALLDIYNKKWIDDWYVSKKQREDYFKKGKQILKTFYTAQEEAGWTIPLSLEGWFKIKVGEHTVHGRIDRVDQLNDGTLHIIDYKTGKSKEKLSSDDKDQLLVYQLATQTLPEYRNIGATSKLTFYYLNDSIETSFVGTDADLERIQEKVQKTIDAIAERQFDPTPNKITCQYCDYRDICDFRA